MKNNINFQRNAEREMSETQTRPHMIDNTAIKGREDHYMQIEVDITRIIKSWKESLYSFEWLLDDGRIKDLEELPEAEQAKRQKIENALQNNKPIERPVLGIGMLDNVEIGIGKAALLTIAAHGHTTMPVHIPKSNENDFKAFLADI